MWDHKLGLLVIIIWIKGLEELGVLSSWNEGVFLLSIQQNCVFKLIKEESLSSLMMGLDVGHKWGRSD